MLFVYHFNWGGTPEELKEFKDQVKSIIKETEGVEFTGLFTPTSEWNYVLVMNAANYEKPLQVIRTYIKNFGWTKTSLAKVELFHTFEELGLKE